jgi:hypothetical protein
VKENEAEIIEAKRWNEDVDEVVVEKMKRMRCQGMRWAFKDYQKKASINILRWRDNC